MIVTFAIAVFLLVIVAMATAIGFATRGAVANAREIVEVLHFVGASDGSSRRSSSNISSGSGRAARLPAAARRR